MEKYLQIIPKEHYSRQKIYFEYCRYVFQHSPEQAAALLEKYFTSMVFTGHLQNTQLNELGIMFLKTGDKESARKIFDKVNDSLKMQESQSPQNSSDKNFYLSNYSQQPYGKFFADRYKAGWKEPTLQFLETFTDPVFRCRIFCSFADILAEEQGEEYTVVIEKFLHLAYESAFKTDADTITHLLFLARSSLQESNDSVEENEKNQSIRSRMLWLVTRTALLADHLTLARQSIRQERLDSKNTAVIGDMERFIHNNHKFVSRLVAKEDLTAAMFVLKEVDSADLKYRLAFQLIMRLLESPPPQNSGIDNIKSLDVKPIFQQKRLLPFWRNR
jgi:hypothetical protein